MENSASKIIFSATKERDRYLFKEILGEVLNIRPIKILSEYKLSKNMTDSEIQEVTGSSPLEMIDFLKLIFLLLMEPWKGKEELEYELEKKDGPGYIFHVKTSSGELFSYHVFYYSGMDHWTIKCEKFDKLNMLNEGQVGSEWTFLYFC